MNENKLVKQFVGQRIHQRAELVRALYAMLKDDYIKFMQIQSLVPADNEVINEGRDGVVNMTNNQLRAFMALVDIFIAEVEQPNAIELISGLCVRSLDVTVPSN